MIRFGPSGIPLSCKGRTLRDGIEDIHNLGLTAMEVQLVRVNLNERYAGDEDLGRTPREIPGELVVTHLGMFGELEPKEAMNRIAKNLRLIRDAYKKGKIRSRLGIEASGRTEVVGSLDELLTLVKNAKGVLPVLNFAHVHARGFGLFKRPEDFDDVLSKVEKVSDGGHIHAHFSGVEHADGNELRYTPIKKGDLRVEPLAECLLDEDYDLTIVSSSPLLEHDAMYMKVILERVLAKRLMRPTKPEKEEKEERGAKRR